MRQFRKVDIGGWAIGKDRIIGGVVRVVVMWKNVGGGGGIVGKEQCNAKKLFMNLTNIEIKRSTCIFTALRRNRRTYMRAHTPFHLEASMLLTFFFPTEIARAKRKNALGMGVQHNNVLPLGLPGCEPSSPRSLLQTAEGAAACQQSLCCCIPVWTSGLFDPSLYHPI